MEAKTSEEPDTAMECQDTKFEQLCMDLGLQDCVKTRAWIVWCDIEAKLDDNQSSLDRADWYTAAIYMAAIDTSMPYGPNDPHIDKQSPPCIPLTELLKKSHINVIRFIERMRRLRDDMTFSEAVKSHLTNVEKRYCIVSPLFHRFDREWGTVFREEENEKGGDAGTLPFDQTEGQGYRKSLCWTLFLHARERLLGESEELIHTYHLLLLCLEFVVRSTPSFQLQQPFDMLRLKSAENLDQNGNNVVILRKLADQFLTGYEELQSLQATTENFFLTLRNKDGDIDLSQLKTLYYERYSRVGDLDELQFLQHDPHLMPEPNKIPNTPSSSSNGIETPVTPIRAAMNTIQQLKNILSHSQDTPCTELLNYFKNCATNPEKVITTRVSDFGVKFVNLYTAVVGHRPNNMAEQRYKQSVRLYYRVMKTLLDMEKERLSQLDFSHLLNNDTFHRSLLACSVEIILMTYNVTWNPSRCAVGSEDSSLSFPWILTVFDLFPYDFYKVLESFIKAEPNLTREIIKHMTVIENKILDRIAWKSDSPLYEAISKMESVNSNLLSPTKDLTNGHGSTTSSAAELYLSPLRGQQARVTSPAKMLFTSPRKQPTDTRGSPDTKTTIPPKLSQSLKMFFNKVCRLGYHRLKTLCDLLQIPKDVQQKIWTCFEFCITCKAELMKNRHLDQIMMCSVYGICKVSEHDIKFKDIVKAYGTQPHAEPQIYKQALIDGQEYDSIISFYNRVYMQMMKNFILQFAKPVQPNLSPVPRPVNTSLNASPVYSIPGRSHFYVSPLRESPFKSPTTNLMTPRSRQLYSFGEGLGSADKLKTINESLSAFKSKNITYVTTPKSLKRLSFDTPEGTNQNSPDTSQEDTMVTVVKKKRVIPPAVIPKPGEPVRNSNSNSTSSGGSENIR